MTKNILALLIVIHSSTLFAAEFNAVIMPDPNGNGNLQYIPDIVGDTPTPPTPPSSFTPVFKTMDGGQEHSVAISSSGELIVVGYNNSGELGLGHSNAVYDWTGTGVNNVIEVDAASYNSFALDSNGDLWSSETGTWTVVLSNVKQFSAGNGFLLALMNDGSLNFKGENSSGQSGNGGSSDTTTWVNVSTAKEFGMVVAGDQYSMAIDVEGNVWATGKNDYGQLGLGAGSGNQYAWIQTTFTNAKEIYAGSNFTFVVNDSGDLYASGRNTYNQLGISNTSNKEVFTDTGMDNIKQISGGSFHSVLLSQDGSVYVAGRSNYGQMGFGDGTTVTSFTDTGIDNATAVGAGFGQSIAIEASGTAYGAGKNMYGQLGLGFQENFTMSWTSK